MTKSKSREKVSFMKLEVNAFECAFWYTFEKHTVIANSNYEILINILMSLTAEYPIYLSDSYSCP